MIQTFSLNLGGGSGTASQYTLDPTSTNFVYEWFEDFNNYQFSTTQGNIPLWGIASGTGAQNQRGTATSGESNRVGIVQCSPGSASGAHYAHLINIQNIYLGGATHSFSTSIKLGTVPDGTNDYAFFSGFAINWPTPGNAAAILMIDRSVSTTNWQARTSRSGSSTTTDTGVAFSTSWTNLRVEINAAGTQVTFYINGTLVATHTTNLPDNTAIGPIACGRWVAGAAQTVNHDWVYYKYQLASTRGTF